MASFNKVILLGNVTRDIELRYLSNGTAVCDFSLAINNGFTAKDGTRREEVTFVEVTFFARPAEIAAEYLRKGSPVLIEGRLKQEAWQDKTTGQNRSKLKVIGESLQLLGSKDRAASGSQPAGGSQSSAESQSSADAAAEYGADDSPF